jgi:hypothetical protein
MCFSAEASFAGGIIISAIGFATVSKVHKSSQVVFASIPLFFGIQQVAEGCLWLTLPVHEFLIIQKICTYIFLVMALVIWPLIIPVSIILMEKKPKKKRTLIIMLISGLTVSVYYAFCLLFLQVTPEISGYHIFYKSNFPEALSNPVFMVYLVVTIVPLFVSSIKRTRIMAVLMMLSCLVTAVFYKQYLTSVWCFFAAFISGIIFWILSDSKRDFVLDKIRLLKI